MRNQPNLDFTVMVLPGAYASGVAVTLDMLQAAAVLAPRCGQAVPRWRVCSMAGGAVPLSSGLSLPTEAWRASRGADPSGWIIPGWGVADADGLAQALHHPDAQALAHAVAAHVARGGAVAAACSAVFLLHAAGVLDGRRFTTSWWLAPQLLKQGAGAAAQLDADAMVCVDGPIVTAGAALAQGDLMLMLLRQRFGAALADAVGRCLLVDGRQAQAPFVVPALLSNGHAWIAQLLQAIEQALPEVPGVAQLAAQFAVSPRTLSRRVRDITGHSPLALIQQVRLNRARQLIESSRLSIEAVAAQVGYQDATALRRLMRQRTGAQPSAYRRSRWAEPG